MAPNTMLDALGRVQLKSLCLGLLAFFALLTFAGALKAEDKNQPVIYWAESNYTNGSIAIEGENLAKPTVQLDGKLIKVSSSNDHQIVAQMPAGVQSGTYLLEVTTGTGSKNTVSFDLTIGGAGPMGPMGPQGPKGDIGPLGVAGPQGPKGDTGAIGATGPQGPKGDTGAIGATGPQGPKGDTGATGAAGPQGPKGDTGAIGATGPQGPKGDTGATGAAGPQGPKGDTGATGAAGATGPQGPKGDTGATGATGPQGVQGIAGATGSQGPTGPAGPTGPSGTTGQNAFIVVQQPNNTQLGPNTVCNFSLVPNMSRTITVPNTLPGSFVYATATGNFSALGTGYTNAAFVITVDGSPSPSTISSPQTYISSYTTSTINNYTTFSWTVNGLFPLNPGNHTVSLYAADCGQTGISIGLATGATLTGMVLNQ